MSIELLGKPIIKSIKEEAMTEVEVLKSRNIIPKLGIVQVGNRPDDISYRNSIIKKFNSVGIEVEIFNYDESISMEEFLEKFKQINNNSNIHGILLFRPLPKQLDYNVIKNTIDPKKDIDCMNPINLQRIFEGDLSGFSPCTAKAVVEILKYYNIELQGKNVAIINRSMVVGKPLAMMLLAENSTVTICHSKTKNLKQITSNADIVVCASARANMFTEEYFNDKSVVIDVGINDNGEGGICGDVDFKNVKENVQAITPVPRGVGGVTSTLLMYSLVKAAKMIEK